MLRILKVRLVREPLIGCMVGYTAGLGSFVCLLPSIPAPAINFQGPAYVCLCLSL